jgi:hypothetical protein
MDQHPPNYRREFWRSPQHIGLALLTLGGGFMTGMLLPLIVGGTLYALGWIYLPDLPFFSRWVDRREAAARQAAALAQVEEFRRKRDALVSSLAPSRTSRYTALAAVCRDIEMAGAESPLASPDPASDPRLRKLDELMWTYLRLLGIEESLERFLETERREDLPALLREAEAEATRLTEEVTALKAQGPGPTLETRQRYLGSRLERLEVLRKRQQRIEQAQSNLALVLSEQERLDQQIKLIRADAVASKNAEALTARIDATVEHLDQTNKWLAEMDEFKDLVADMPATELRVGYAPTGPAVPPPLLQANPAPRARPAMRQSGKP